MCTNQRFSISRQNTLHYTGSRERDETLPHCQLQNLPDKLQRNCIQPISSVSAEQKHVKSDLHVLALGRINNPKVCVVFRLADCVFCSVPTRAHPSSSALTACSRLEFFPFNRTPPQAFRVIYERPTALGLESFF